MTDCCDFLPEKSGPGRTLAVDGFHALWMHSAPHLGELVDLDDPAVRAAVEDLERAGNLEVDIDGVLVGVHGLTSHPTRHRIERADGKVNDTWCALDAIGIPAALDVNATAVTDCPTCGVQLRIETPTGTVADSDVRLWLPTAPCMHLIDEFCAHANLFCSRQHLDAMVGASGTPSGHAVTLEDVLELGRASWADVAA